MLRFLKGQLVFVRVALLLAAAVLIGVGIATIYAVGHPAEAGPAAAGGELSELWRKQAQYAFVGAGVFAAVNLVSYRRLGRASYWIYSLVLVLLAVLLLDKIVDLGFVPVRNNARRWISFTIAGRALPSIQPSELCKVAYILALAWYLRYRSNYRSFKVLIGPFILTLLPMVLILLEPDLGTVMLMMPVLFTMLFAAGAKVKHLAVMICLAVLVSPLMWRQINPYQRIRISAVLLQSERVQELAEKHPSVGRILVGRPFSKRQLESHWGFHLMRSKYAVASGGAAGYGYRQGPFVKYDFLPYRHNDFIFAVIAHQWGFVGCIMLLGLYVIIGWAGLEIAGHNTDPFSRLLAVGIVSMLTVEVFVSVSMTLGLMPITGLTLPFVSYGGSSLVVHMACVGLLNNVGRSRPFNLSRR